MAPEGEIDACKAASALHSRNIYKDNNNLGRSQGERGRWARVGGSGVWETDSTLQIPSRAPAWALEDCCRRVREQRPLLSAQLGHTLPGPQPTPARTEVRSPGVPEEGALLSVKHARRRKCLKHKMSSGESETQQHA